MSQLSLRPPLFPGRVPYLWSNFLVGDVQTGIMPLFSVDLIGLRHWPSVEVGELLALGGFVALIFQPIAGILADRLSRKRELFLLLALCFAGGVLLMAGAPTAHGAIEAQILLGIAQGGFMPVLGAVAMGLTGREGFPRAMSWAQGMGHGGSVFGALSVALIGFHGSMSEVYLFYAGSSLAAAFLLFAVPGTAIDPVRAREAEERHPSWAPRKILTLPFVLFLVMVLVFFMANTAMLPLAGLKLQGMIPSLSDPSRIGLLVAATQLVMIPFSLLSSSFRAGFGAGGAFFLLPFAILSLRGIVLSGSGGVWGILFGQVLDGALMGILSVMLPVTVAEMVRGSGRFNFASGLTGAIAALGGSASQVISGMFFDRIGVDRTLMVFAGIALCGLILSLGDAWRSRSDKVRP
ncbi:MAG: MFS transporter [Leptospirillia bacterium]